MVRPSSRRRRQEGGDTGDRSPRIIRKRHRCSEDGSTTTGAAFVICVAAAVGLGFWIRPILTDDDPPLPPSTTSTAPPPTSSPTTAKAQGPFEKVFEQATSSVLRLDAVVCQERGGSGVGSGFLIDALHVATAAHVVGSAVAITARNGEHVRVARVVGLDRGKDLALLKLDRPLEGKPFQLVDQRVPLTTKVAALGYPYGRGLSPAEGTINGYDRKEAVDDRTIFGLIQTDADINPGNSGGPLVTPEGQAVGLVIAGLDQADGLALAVDATLARPLLQRWQQIPEPPQEQDCADPSVPDEGVGVDTLVTGRAAAEISVALGVYFNAINSGQYRLAWQQYSEQRRSKISVEALADGTKSSRTSGHKIVAAATNPDGSTLVSVTFISNQDPGEGPKGREQETCTEWSNDYRMVFEEGRWVMDLVTGHAGAPNSGPCQEGD